MNARVFVLLLVSAAFMAMWNDDQSHSSQIRLSRDRARAKSLTIEPAHVDVTSPIASGGRRPKFDLPASGVAFGQILMTASVNAVESTEHGAEIDVHSAAQNNEQDSGLNCQEVASPASSHETITAASEPLASDVRKPSVQPVIPLPKDLQPGTWHAISHDGDTFRITIERTNSAQRSANTMSEDSAVAESKFCIVTGPDNLRWCFIKEQIKATLEANRSANEYLSPIHE